MTYSKLESSISGLATWLAANFPTYLTRANLGMPTPAAPSINGYTVDATVKEDRLPWCLVNLDSATREDAGPGYQYTTAQVSVAIVVNMPKTSNMSLVLMRYADALIDCLGSDPSLGGICTRSSLNEIDKQEEPGGDKSRGGIFATLEIMIESLSK